jgi:hypothetical protein
MRSIFLLIAVVCLSLECFSQTSDFLVLKKNGRTVKTYMKGSYIEFIHKNGSGIAGMVDRIYRDSISITWFDVRMAVTYWGTQVADTVSRNQLRFHYHEIAAIPRPAKSFEFIRNGDLFMITGLGYAFLHTFNGIIQKTFVSPTVVGISLGVATLGFTMHKLRKHYWQVGRKYKLEYINLSPK